MVPVTAAVLAVGGVVGGWVDSRLNPPCDASQRGQVMRTDSGRWLTVEQGQPGNTEPPCRLRDLSRPTWKGEYVPQ